MRELLLIDDNTTLLKVMGRSLSVYYKVHTFTHPKDAIAYMQANSSALDVIICDYKMLDINGLQVLAKATALKKETIRILLTGYADAAVFENSTKICDAIIDKNICKNIKDIVDLIDKLTLQKQQAGNV